MNAQATINRIASELKANAEKTEVDQLSSMVLDMHDEQSHSGHPAYCDWAACRYAAGARSAT